MLNINDDQSINMSIYHHSSEYKDTFLSDLRLNNKNRDSPHLVKTGRLSTIFQLYHGDQFYWWRKLVPGENHRLAISHWQTLWHNVVSSPLVIEDGVFPKKFSVHDVSCLPSPAPCCAQYGSVYVLVKFVKWLTFISH